MDWNIAGAASDILGGLFQTGYNLYTNKRDFDYQKALQQQIFNREDNAVQRRMADLQAAGLNPNLAAGSAAGAGAVVSRSNTNDLNVGSALDTLQAMNNIKLQKQQTMINQQELNMKSQELRNLNQKNTLELANLYKQLGFDIDIEYDPESKPDTPFVFWYNKDNKHSLSDSPLWQNIQYTLDSNKNSAAILESDADWATANKLLNTFGNIFKIFK